MTYVSGTDPVPGKPIGPVKPEPTPEELAAHQVAVDTVVSTEIENLKNKTRSTITQYQKNLTDYDNAIKQIQVKIDTDTEELAKAQNLLEGLEANYPTETSNGS